MFQNNKAVRALEWIADLSLCLCMFLETAVPHTTVSQASLLFFFLCTGVLAFQKRHLYFSWWMIVAGLVIVWSAIVSFGWALDRTVSLQMVQTLIITTAFFFFLFQYLLLRGNLRRYLGVYVVSALLIVGYLFYIERTLDWSVSRLGLTDGVHPNIVGMVSAFAFGACILLVGEKKRLFWLLPIPFLLIAVVLTMSVKSAALAGFLLVALLLVRFPKHWGWKLGGLIVGGFIIFYLAVMTDNPLSRGVLHRVRDVAIFIFNGEGMGGSLTERSSLASAAFSWFLKRPFTGWGLGCFRFLEGSLGVYSHCNYTELLVSGGIPLAVIYYAGQLGAFIYASRALKRTKSIDASEENLALRRLVIAFCVFLAARFILDIAVVSYFERQDAVFSVLLIAAARLLLMQSGAKEGDALRAAN